MFCCKCGTKMIPVQESVFCKVCGLGLKPEDEFCTQCGAKRNTKKARLSNRQIIYNALWIGMILSILISKVVRESVAREYQEKALIKNFDFQRGMEIRTGPPTNTTSR